MFQGLPFTAALPPTPASPPAPRAEPLPATLSTLSPCPPCCARCARQVFADKMVEVLGSLEDDFVWVHDYHLLVLPSLLRKRFHRIK